MPDNLKKRRDKFKTASKSVEDGAAGESGGGGQGGGKKSSLFGRRITRPMKTNFCVQFSTLQDAGLPVLRSLRILEGQQRPGRFKDIVGAVAEDVEGGSPLSEAFAKHPSCFDSLYVNIVRAGEAGGLLTEVFRRLADFMERSDRLARKVRGALAYPTFVICFAIAILTFLIVIVVPQFEEIFRGFGKELPKITRILIDTSKIAGKFWWAIILLPMVFVGLWRVIRKSEGGRLMTDRIILKMPLFGSLTKKTQVSRFARTLGTLSSSGVALLESLEIVKGTSSNEVLRQTIDKVKTSVSEGESIAQPLGESGIFDDIVVNMVDVGEETGELDKMLMKVADRYDEEVDATVGALLSILEPLLIVFMGLIVGFIVIALFLPLLELQSQFK